MQAQLAELFAAHPRRALAPIWPRSEPPQLGRRDRTPNLPRMTRLHLRGRLCRGSSEPTSPAGRGGGGWQWAHSL